MSRKSSLGSDEGSGASGREALATYRDDDWEDVVRAVHNLPKIAQERGMAVAIAWGRHELRSLVGLLGVGKPATKEAAAARAATAVFFEPASLRLACDGDTASFNWRVQMLDSFYREYFEQGVVAVFERSSPTESRPYLPQIPQRP
jgi:hypothetical protein